MIVRELINPHRYELPDPNVDTWTEGSCFACGALWLIVFPDPLPDDWFELDYCYRAAHAYRCPACRGF